jgi:hypothetical protein
MTHTTTLTEKELQSLKAIIKSDYYQGVDSKVWDWSVYESLSFKGKVRSGVFSSLTQKGLVEIYFDTIGITKQGYELLKEINMVCEKGYLV